MDRHDEWFVPENVEGQIEQYQQATDQSTVNAHMLHDLQHIAQSDAQRLAQIRERLLGHVTHNPVREPIPLQHYRKTNAPPSQPAPRHAKKQSAFLVKLISGIAAVFVIASTLLTFTLFQSYSQQERKNVRISVVKPVNTTIVSPIIKGKAAFLIDATTGNVLVDINSHTQVPIASLTTIMTAVVAIDNANLDQYVTVKQATLNEVSQGVPVAGLQVGDQIQLRELLYALLLPSGGDAALVIAHTVGGNIQNFVAMMNSEAQQLQLNDTHFSSPYSSSASDEYSSAADLTHLTQYAMQLSDFASAVASPEHTLAATYLHHSYTWATTNTVHITYPDLHILKSGYDARAGAYMVFSVQRNDHLLIGTEIGAQSEDILAMDVKKIL